MEVAMKSGTVFSLPVPNGYTALAYVFDGQGIFGGQEVVSVSLVVFGNGEQVEIRTADSPVRFMFMAGAPFREPIVPYGPFVMNTREEIQQALADLRNGTFVQNQ
jgi:redox-sensitive bicupin YhaK (pirin superfamily)